MAKPNCYDRILATAHSLGLDSQVRQAFYGTGKAEQGDLDLTDYSHLSQPHQCPIQDTQALIDVLQNLLTTHQELCHQTQTLDSMRDHHRLYLLQNHAWTAEIVGQLAQFTHHLASLEEHRATLLAELKQPHSGDRVLLPLEYHQDLVGALAPMLDAVRYLHRRIGAITSLPAHTVDVAQLQSVSATIASTLATCSQYADGLEDLSRALDAPTGTYPPSS
ncbi:hypothetical protein H4R35_000695 [Dimargaris xerosporica]|nr:hypothetical protein H4R35_000695 [Dimargaris xerosporica]